MPAALREGLYEHLVTEALAAAVADARAQVSERPLDPADAHLLLARHVARHVERALLTIPTKDRPQGQSQLADAFLARVAELTAVDLTDQRVAQPPRRLDAVYRTAEPVRPTTPLSSSTLLTRNRAEPALGQELAREIASSDEVDALVAFITVGGVRALRDGLESFSRHGGKLRVLTTTFSGTTEVEALESLARLPGVEVRISYDTRRTRLHAKAWLFRRASGLHTAYVGSANLTQTALGAGQEWMVKVCAADLPHVIEKFEGTFDSLWNDPEFEPFGGTPAERDRLRRALQTERGTGGNDDATVLFALRPFPFQEEILDRLEAERTLHHRTKNLVVAATGTGKTVIAAFDYLRQAQKLGLPPRLLFIAHRRELLEQARTTFRSVLRDASFGELWTDGALPKTWDHVFATIQSAARELLPRLGAEHFRYVVIDECHHAPADSYQHLVPAIRPDILLGLTATPERADGKSLLGDFDGHVSAELRLWHALDKQLLVPFEYYGVSDGTDLHKLRWSRTGYAISELSKLYTGNDARVDLALAQLQRRVLDVRKVRALAFCVSVEHAEYMAKALTARGLPAMAVHGGTDDAARADAPRRLREREVNVLCTCDLYNEGVDLPFVDTLLLLRPTSSATLFLQQIGRGLRIDHGKLSCLVLDYIGQHRSEFRFDNLYAALTGIPRARIKKDLEEGFPYLPSGCVLQLDPVARERVLATLKASLQNRLITDLKELAEQGTPTLAQFLEATGRDVEEVYRNDGSWTKLKAEANLVPANDRDTDDLTRRLGWLLHVDEPSRLDAWTTVLHRAAANAPLELSPYDRRRLHMLDFQLDHRGGVLRIAEDTARDLAHRPVVHAELTELAEHLRERIAFAPDRYPVDTWPLALHRRYARREIVTAIGYLDAGDKRTIPQAGILKLEEERREILLVTLDKSASSFSPTTRYRDYAISANRFHWETQGAAAIDRESGRRYLQSPANGWRFYLFVRETPDAPYAFLGPVRYLSHAGDRPIGITWELETPMTAGLFDRFATLAQG